MYSRPVIIENLNATHTTFLLNFHFCNNITLLMGDSGRGKTVVFNILKELSATDERILCINYLDMNKNIENMIRTAVGKLIVIDNADALLNDEIRKEIALDSKNQYLIIGRNPKNLMATDENLYELRKEKDCNRIRYSLEEYL